MVRPAANAALNADDSVPPDHATDVLCALTLTMSFASTSVKARSPVAMSSAAPSPSVRAPASVIESITGLSLVPLIVKVSVVGVLSALRTVTVSVSVCPWRRAWTAGFVESST